MTSSLPPLNPLLQACGKRTRDIFAAGLDETYKDEEKRCVLECHGCVNNDLSRIPSARIRMSVKLNDEYKEVKQLPAPLLAQQGPVGPARPKEQRKMITAGREPIPPAQHWPLNLFLETASTEAGALIRQIDNTPPPQQSTFTSNNNLTRALQLHKTTRTVKPTYHPPWKLMRVISGHLGWVRSVAVEPGNKWFATGAGDRVIKIWDLASGELKLSLTGHISTVRGLAVSSRHPYLFSCGEDKVCWLVVVCMRTFTHRRTDGQVLGPRGKQGHPTLPWALVRGICSQSAPHARCSCDFWS